MQKSKTLLLTSSYPRYKGDYAGNFVAQFAKVLGKKQDVHVLAPFDEITDDSFSAYDLPVTFFGNLPLKLKSPFYKAGGFENLSDWKTIPFLPLFLLDMLKNAYQLATDADNLISHWMLPAGLVAALVKRKNQKLLLVVHGSDWQLVKILPQGKRLAKFIISKTDTIITVANYQKQEIIGLFKNSLKKQVENKIIHIPMGIFIDEFSKEHKSFTTSEKPVILAAGRLVKIKGFDRLAHALQNLNVKLYLAGDGPEKQHLEKLYKASGIDCEFLGMLKQEELVRLYHQADLLVAPSQKLNRREEGTPRVILEAMAAKCPIVATATGGIGELLEHEKDSLLDYSNDKELQSNIKKLLESETLRKTLANNAFLKVQKLDWSNLLSLINNCLR